MAGRHEAVIAIRKIISEQESRERIQQVVDSGIIPVLLRFLREDEWPQLQLEACWVITNIASGSNAQCESIVEKGCIPALIKLLYSSRPFVTEQALWGIGNIAGDCSKFRDQLLSEGGHECVIRIAENSKKVAVIRQAMWALSNLCRGSPQPKYEIIKPAIPVLCRAVTSGVLGGEELQDCLWAIGNNSEGQKSRVQRLVEVPNFVACLVQLCYQGEYSVIIPCLRIMGNISNGNEHQTQALLDCGCLALLEALLDHEKKAVRREACWILSNVCAGSKRQIAQVAGCQALLLKVALLFVSDCNEVKREICYVFGNMCHLGETALVYRTILELRVFDTYLALLADDGDAKLLEKALTTLYDILVVGERAAQPNPFLRMMESVPGCLERLEALQRHDSGEIYRLVLKIVQRFFTLEDENIF